MFGIVCGLVLIPVAFHALLREDIRLRWAIPIGLLPACFALGLGIPGCLIACALTFSYTRIDLA